MTVSFLHHRLKRNITKFSDVRVPSSTRGPVMMVIKSDIDASSYFRIGHNLRRQKSLHYCQRSFIVMLKLSISYLEPLIIIPLKTI